MTIYTLLFGGYNEPQMSRSEAPPIRPRPAGSALTTHKLELAANHHTNVTLTLSNSHSPESKYRPLYYAPCTVDGEVTLDMKKAEEIKALYVSVEGTDLKYGYAGSEFGIGRGPAAKTVPFWRVSTDNLAENSTPTRITPEGPHTFGFSLRVPDSFPTYHSSAYKISLKDKIDSLLHHTHKTEEVSIEQQPLPPTSLPHHDANTPPDKVVAGYTISVTLQFSSKMEPDILASHDILVLLMKDQEVEAEDKPDQSDSKGLPMQATGSEPAQALLPDTPLHHA